MNEYHFPRVIVFYTLNKEKAKGYKATTTFMYEDTQTDFWEFIVGLLLL